MTKTILIVDDNLQVARALERELRAEFAVRLAADGDDALARLEQAPADVVLSDYRMAGMNGVQLLTEVMRRHPATVRLLLTGYPNLDALDPAVCSVVEKPWDGEKLRARIRALLAEKEAARPAAAGKASGEERDRGR